MPVLSPHRSSASTLAGSYRSTYSTADRPFFSPRTYSYSERYSTRSFTDSEGRRIISRSGSVTEDGVTSRFREDSREGSLRRDSLSRDSGISSLGGEYRRDGSVSRENSRLSAINVHDSVAELRNKYSPANYVPACIRERANDNLSRSKSNHDIGRPPIEPTNHKLKKKVMANGVINSNTTNLTDLEDDNGNRASVADLRKRFDEERTKRATPPLTLELEQAAKLSENRFKKLDNRNKEEEASQPEEDNETMKKNSNKSRVNNFPSYIPSRADNERKSEDKDLVSTISKTGLPSGSVRRERTPEEYSKTSSALGLNGLKNIGNTCFMNSVIQCLSNTKLLLEYMTKEMYSQDVNTTTSSMKGALIRAFAEVIRELWSSDSSDRVVNTTSLKSQIQRFAPRFIGYAQQDAQEFLRYLLEGLHEDVNRVVERPKPILTEIDEKLTDAEKSAESWGRYLRMDNSKIVDYFVGQLKSTLKCTHCGHCSVTFDPFWDLSLPIPQRAGQVRLSQCLESFTREETLDGDEKPTCSKCKERRKCTKSFSIQKFPKILVIHLKRFSLAERFRGKLSVTVDFPLEGLDMSQYAADSGLASRYNLYAISNHSGTTYSGHYTAYCRHPYTRAWHEYNDSRVSPISSKSIISGEAYVLFYELEGTRSHL